MDKDLTISSYFSRIKTFNDIFENIYGIINYICDNYKINNLSFLFIKNEKEEFDYIELEKINLKSSKTLERIFNFSKNKKLKYIERYSNEIYDFEDIKRNNHFKYIIENDYHEIYDNDSYLKKLIESGIIKHNHKENRIKRYENMLIEDPEFVKVYPTFSDYFRKVIICLKSRKNKRIFGFVIVDGFLIEKMNPNESLSKNNYLNILLDTFNIFTELWEKKNIEINRQLDLVYNSSIIFLNILNNIEKPEHTYNHSINCQLFYTEFLKYLNRKNIKKITVPDFFSAKWGSLIHDVGKIMIPANILIKTGKLTQLEFEEMKKHSYKGYQILNTGILPKLSLDIVKSHHEKLDGSGYPEKLEDEDIDDLIKIFTIIDIFEALTGKRHYKIKFYKRVKKSNLVNMALDNLTIDSEKSKLSKKYVEYFNIFINDMINNNDKEYFKDHYYEKMKKEIIIRCSKKLFI